MPVAHLGREHAGGDGADAGQRHEPLAQIVLMGLMAQLLLQFADPGIEVLEVLVQPLREAVHLMGRLGAVMDQGLVHPMQHGKRLLRLGLGRHEAASQIAAASMKSFLLPFTKGRPAVRSA